MGSNQEIALTHMRDALEKLGGYSKAFQDATLMSFPGGKILGCEHGSQDVLRLEKMERVVCATGVHPEGGGLGPVGKQEDLLGRAHPPCPTHSRCSSASQKYVPFIFPTSLILTFF